MKRGEIYYIRYDNSVGSEQSVGRPCLIVSSQKGIDTAPVVQCVFLSTQQKHGSHNILLTSINRRSYAVCNQLNTLDKSRFENFMGEVTPEEMAQVDDALKNVLGLTDEVVTTVREDDYADLRVELELHKALYEKTLEKLVALRMEMDEKPRMEKPRPEKKMSDEEVVAILESAGMKSRSDRYGTKPGKAKAKTGAKPININTATTRDFESIGVSTQTARNIVNYRNKHGYFISLEDLLMVPRFGKGCLNVFGSLMEV